MPRRANSVCSTPGCPHLSQGGKCGECRREAEQARGSARERGYGREHETRFRKAVLARDPICRSCGKARSTVADHWPLSRRQLVAQGMDPDEPQHGRGLCKTCHDHSTSERQPGGWNAR